MRRPPCYRRFALEVVCSSPCRIGSDYPKTCLRDVLEGCCSTGQLKILNIKGWCEVERFDQARASLNVETSMEGEIAKI